MGASGLFVALIGWLGGSTSIVNISNSTLLSTADCARWLRNDPHAATCYRAALSDWASETVVNRLAVGGMALILLLIILRLRSRPKRTSRLLPPVVVSSIGLSIFGATALWLIGQGVDTMLIGANGAGRYLGSAPPVLGVALWFAARLVHELRAQPERPGYGEVISSESRLRWPGPGNDERRASWLPAPRSSFGPFGKEPPPISASFGYCSG